MSLYCTLNVKLVRPLSRRATEHTSTTTDDPPNRHLLMVNGGYNKHELSKIEASCPPGATRLVVLARNEAHLGLANVEDNQGVLHKRIAKDVWA